jgi:hypothetical protein
MSANIIPLDYTTMKFEKPLTADDIRVVVRGEIHRNNKRCDKIIDGCASCIYSICLITLIGIIYVRVGVMNRNINYLMTNHNSTAI